jgi:NAD(P)H-nitrite reductase large subunit
LGLEAANGLMLRGMQVTVVHIMPWLMERQLDDTAGKLLLTARLRPGKATTLHLDAGAAAPPRAPAAPESQYLL